MTAILGGGIGGLSAAFYALENPRLGALTLFEASERLGGWIRTKRSPTGATFEKGPRTVRPFGEGGKNTLRMVEELNLVDQLIKIPQTHPTSKNRLIYADKKLHVLPSSFLDLFSIKSPMKRPLIMSLWHEFKAPKVEKEDEDMYSFVQRRLGQDVADYMISPMVCGIAAGDAGTLVDHLADKIDIQLKKCTNLTFRDKEVDVEVDGKLHKFDKVISSLPARNLAELVKKQHPELAQELEAIPSVTVAVINFEFKDKVAPIEAFGFLIPPNQNLPLLGVIFDSCVRSEKSTVLTAMMGGAWFDQYFGKNPTEEYLLSTAIEQLRDILKLKQDPMHVDVSILKDCIPQQIVGHDARIKRIHDYITAHGMSLAICGSSYQGIGVNDVILSSKNAIDDMLLRDINA